MKETFEKVVEKYVVKTENKSFSFNKKTDAILEFRNSRNALLYKFYANGEYYLVSVDNGK